MSTDNNKQRENGQHDETRNSPPAFLDLADSSARLGGNMPEITARVEMKRMEHEKQRLFQRKMFDEQMRMLEKQQEQELLNIPYDQNAGAHANGLQHLAASAPTTPPRVNGALPDEHLNAQYARRQDGGKPSETLGTTTANKRKSVTYASTVLNNDRHPTPPPNSATNNAFSRAAGAKSMPGSRRGSPSADELTKSLAGISLNPSERASSRGSPGPGGAPQSMQPRTSRYGNEDSAYYAKPFNAGMMLDEQLDEEMHNAMRNLPTSDADKYHGSFANKTSSAALDLAHRSQGSPRPGDREQSAEWAQYNGQPRSADLAGRRSLNGPNYDDPSSPAGSGSSSVIPHSQALHHQNNALSPSSRRGSPPVILDSLAVNSVPSTPIGYVNGQSGAHINKVGGGIPHSPDAPGFGGTRISPQSAHRAHKIGEGDLQGPMSRQYDAAAISFNSIQTGIHDLQQYNSDSVYNLNNGLDDDYNAYGFEPRQNGNTAHTSGSTALYHHNGARYGLGMGPRTSSAEKLNGLHGSKHKRNDVDREFNRFAGTRLEDLQGEIAALCKDQHGCRYLQKKLEEGSPEHRDMIFRETFGHFADLMTDPFGNYLCQKLLEYSTDEQRNVICESVAQDLVNISLNMHGTRAVQKMIDFLSARRQADLRYNTQIHSIIKALSQHVVVLIKDLNGNHVIQKCLNKLAPEDNQFIYNAVAANCVEVATHRHGCCVLQRCVDHASEPQRAQLVNEITYNALTLVQDPYGNYVVQYILDLNDPRFSDAVIRQFAGNVCALSVQKFSSNVIEKCIRVAEHSTRKMLIEELLNRTRLEKLLRDSYGNYCVQTALDYAEPNQRAMLVEGIRPVLPLIRNTPYGKRIQNKLQREQMDHYGGAGGIIGGPGFSPQNMSIGLGAPGVGLGGMGAMPNRGGGLPGGHGHLATGNHSIHGSGALGDMYGSQNSIYGGALGGGSLGGGLGGSLPNHVGPFIGGQQGGFGGSSNHLGGLSQHQNMDGYVIQSQVAPGGGFTSNSNHFGGFGGLAGNVSDPYQQRNNFGYGM